MSFVQVDVPDETWQEFKKYVSKELTLADAIIILIKKHIKSEVILYKENVDNMESKDKGKVE